MGLPLRGRPIFSITCMITDQIGHRSVLLLYNELKVQTITLLK